MTDPTRHPEPGPAQLGGLPPAGTPNPVRVRRHGAFDGRDGNTLCGADPRR
jgi:hypothetical protein